MDASMRKAREEIADMQEVMDEDVAAGILPEGSKIEPWDWFYYAERVRARKYALDETLTKPYFQIDSVRKGVFYAAERLYGVRIEEVPEVEVYNPVVKAYKLTDADGSLLGIFPPSGMKTPGSNYTGWKWFVDRMYYMALPLITMTFCSLGSMTRYVRASMIDALSLDCIRTARAKGVTEKAVIYSHAWRNALIPIVTLVVGWFLGIFGGSLIFETTFGINGMGKLMISSLRTQDFDVVILMQLFYVAISLIGNLIIDIVYGLVDPRVRVSA